MPLRRRILLTGILVLTLCLAFLANGSSPIGAAPQAVPTFSQTFSPDTIGPGSVSTLIFTITTGEESAENLAFSNDLSGTNILIATPATASTTCSSGSVSAPDGGSLIEFSGGKLAMNASCTVSVNVTSSTAGTHTNTSGDLTSTVGNSGNSSADLTVDTDRPGFTKSFSPGTIEKGQRSRLTFTIDNSLNGTGASYLTFEDELPVGLVVASPANVSDTCAATISPFPFSGGVVTASPGSTIIALSSGGGLNIAAVGANNSCTIGVDILATGIGDPLENTSGELNSQPGTGGALRSSGKAGAVLSVPFDYLRLEKSFVDDPITPGGTGTLQFTIRNFDRGQEVTNIEFTDDLDAALSGLTAIGLPASDVCGDGSQLSGTGELTLTGGELQAQESCTFSVEVQVPASATPGAYVNTTSAISGEYNGVPSSGEAASDTLFVEPTPLLTKTFTDDPVGAGGTATLEFSITNTSADFAAADITFTDAFPPIIASAATPANGFCGAGSSAGFYPGSNSDSAYLLISGATLSQNDSCTFTVVLDLAEGAPSGIYPNTTSTISALIDGSTVIGPGASDELTVVGAPQLRKEFTDDPVLPGDTVTLEFTLFHDSNAPGDATNISFTDDLESTLSGLEVSGSLPTDPCGAGSALSGTSSLSLSGGTLAPDEYCTFSVSLAVPITAPIDSHPNTTSNVTASVLGVDTIGNSATDDLRISSLTLTKSFADDPVLPGGTVTLDFTLTNHSLTESAADIFFLDTLNSVISGLAAIAPLPTPTCGTLTGTTTLIFSDGTLGPGETCTFSVALEVPAGTASGTYRNTTSSVTATIDGQTVQLDSASDILVVNGDILSVSKSFIDDPVLPGGTVTLELTVLNLSPVHAVSNIAFSDDLDAALGGLISISGTQNDICGAGSLLSGTDTLSLSGGSLAAGASCTFSVLLSVPATAPSGSTAINTTSTPTGESNGLGVSGYAGTDTLRIGTLIVNAEAGGPYSVNEGSSLVVTGTTTTVGNVSFAWDLNNDSIFETPGQVITLTPTDGNATLTIGLQVEAASGSRATDTAIVTVNNVAPTVTAGGDQTINEGSSIALAATFTDPGVNDTHTISVDWGDGSPNGSSLTDSHTYADDGSYTVTVTVTDDGGVGADSFTVTVNNVAPTVTAGGDQTINEGDSIALAASFTDPGVNDTHTISVDWGDGSPNGSALNDSHAYADDGNYTVTVTVTDDDGGVGTDSLTVTVNNVAPTVNAGNDQTINEGSSIALAATFTDPGVNDTHTISVDWGDGSPNGSSLTDSHTYADDGSYTVTVTVTDDDGGVGTDSLTVTVNNVAPAVTAGGDQTINEGSSIALAASFTDPGVNDTHTISVNWGDGSANGSALTDNHTYADDGSYTVTVTVTDDDGGVGTDSLTVTVNNVAPTVNAGNDQTINEGDSIALAATFTDPGVNDTHTISVDWGDGSANGSALNDNHTYADDGSYTVTVTVTDDDGGVGADSLTVTVNNVAPTVDAGPDRRVFEDEVLSITATFSDPGILDTHTATIDWGDGSPVENGTVNQLAGTVSGSHVYPTIGSYTILVTVSDELDSGSDTFELSVDNGFLQNCLFSDDKDVKIGKESQVACSTGSIGKIEVEKDSQVTGDVAAGGEIKLKKDSHVSGDATSAAEVELENGATVGGTISQNSGVSPWAATTLFPTFSVNATGADVKVEKNQSLSLSPGNYGKLDAKENTTLTLAPGEYIFEKLDVDKNSLLIISGPTIIRVEDDVKLKQGVHIQAVATDLLVLGGKNIDLEKDGVYVGSFLAPNGNVKLKQGSQLSGLLYGENVDIEQNSSINPGPALELIAQTLSNLSTSSVNGTDEEDTETANFQLFVPTVNR